MVYRGWKTTQLRDQPWLGGAFKQFFHYYVGRWSNLTSILFQWVAEASGFVTAPIFVATKIPGIALFPCSTFRTFVWKIPLAAWRGKVRWVIHLKGDYVEQQECLIFAHFRQRGAFIQKSAIDKERITMICLGARGVSLGFLWTTWNIGRPFLFPIGSMYGIVTYIYIHLL